jgi:hypothetical protein
MNPYLENPELWSEVHFGLIAVMVRSLNAMITPRYRAAVEKRGYADSLLVGIPDVAVFQRGTSTGIGATDSPQLSATLLTTTLKPIPPVSDIDFEWLQTLPPLEG